MIVLRGVHKDRLSYRSLGSNRVIDTQLRTASTTQTAGYLPDHAEGTDHRDCTTSTIGHDIAKVCRDASICGYCVGSTLDDPGKTPFLIDYSV